MGLRDGADSHGGRGWGVVKLVRIELVISVDR
jgi:hypothetical protein